jgi:twitching motility protein PilT
MTLVDSLLTAMERANGDALVMHVGERPYVITQSRTIDVSAHALGVGAMHGMLVRLLPAEARATLDDLGAVEYALPSRGSNRFTVVAARGGEDIWIEIRRREIPVEKDPVDAASEVSAIDEAPAAEEQLPPIEEAPAAEEPPAAHHEAVAADDSAVEPMPDAVESDASSEEADGVYALDAASVAESAAALHPHVPAAAMASMSAGSGSEIEAPPSTRDPRHEEASEPPPIDPSPAAGAAASDAIEETRPDPMPEPPPPEPFTRTVRIEVPHMMTTQRLPGFARLIRLAAAAGATEVFLTPQARPYLRVDGNVRQMETETPLTSAEVEAFAREIAPESLLSEIRQGASIEWMTDVPEVGRVRCASFSDQRGLGLLCRIVRTRAASIEQLDLGEAVMGLATEPDGLVIVAGPEGSGKSTILSAFVDSINRRRADYVITLEPEVRLVQENRHALISQREVKADAASKLSAARAALREEPDVLVIEGVDSAELFELSLDAAARGLLVIASVPAASATDGVSGLVERVDAGRREAASSRLAASFRGAVSQLLLRKVGGGRLAAREVVLASGDVSRALADPSLAGLPDAIERGRSYGMTRLTDALVGHVQSGEVDVREAYRKSPDRARLASALKAAGVDTSLIDRLA